MIVACGHARLGAAARFIGRSARQAPFDLSRSLRVLSNQTTLDAAAMQRVGIWRGRRAMGTWGAAIRAFVQRLLGWFKGQPTLAASGRTELSTDSTDPIAIQFCHDVNKVSRLLDFLIEEGNPYRIPDDVIEKVEAARSRVKENTPSDAAQRAELLKAYRDLVAIPGTAVLFDFPPTPF